MHEFLKMHVTETSQKHWRTDSTELAFDSRTEKWSGERERWIGREWGRQGTGRKFDIPVGDVCLVSERVWILLTGVDTPFRFPSTHCELSQGNAIEQGQWDLLKGSF